MRPCARDLGEGGQPFPGGQSPRFPPPALPGLTGNTGDCAPSVPSRASLFLPGRCVGERRVSRPLSSSAVLHHHPQGGAGRGKNVPLHPSPTPAAPARTRAVLPERALQSLLPLGPALAPHPPPARTRTSLLAARGVSLQASAWDVLPDALLGQLASPLLSLRPRLLWVLLLLPACDPDGPARDRAPKPQNVC